MSGIGSVLRRPLALGGVLLAGVLATLMTFSYLGGFLDPAHNLRGLKVGVVDADRPVDVAGQHVAAGRQLVDQLRASRRKEIVFVSFSSRADALAAIHDDHVIGAVAAGPEFSSELARVGTSAGSSRPAQLDILTNDGAGLFQAQVFAQVTSEIERDVNAQANRALVSVLSGAGIEVEPARAVTLGHPVKIRTVAVVSVQGKTGRGLAPFYAAVMATLTGFLAAAVTSLMVDVMRGTEHLELLGKDVTVSTGAEGPLATWVTKAILAVSGASLGGFCVAVVAVEVLGMQTSSFLATAGVAVLGASAIALVTLIFLTMFGIGGELLGVLFTTIFGVPSALGVYPVEALPPFFRFTSQWHPMHYLTDAMRSLTFYGGRTSSGLGFALVVLAIWLAGAGVVGFVVALLIQRRVVKPVGQSLLHRAWLHRTRQAHLAEVAA